MASYTQARHKAKTPDSFGVWRRGPISLSLLRQSPTNTRTPTRRLALVVVSYIHVLAFIMLVPTSRGRQILQRTYRCVNWTRSLSAICQWGKEHQQLVCEALGIKRMRTPDGATLHRLFVRLDVEAFEVVLESLELKGQIVTGDALLAQRDICREIKQKWASGSSG